MKKNLLFTKPLLVVLLAGGLQVSAQDLVIKTTADCYVKKNSLEQAQESLGFKYSNATDRRIFLRFDIATVDTSKIDSAYLGMYLTENKDPLTIKLYKVASTDWDEFTTVWPGPDYDTVPFVDFSVNGTMGWQYSGNIAPYIKERYKIDKKLSLAVFNNEVSGIVYFFHSKETVDGNPPQINVEYKEVNSINNRVKPEIKVYPGIVSDYLTIELPESNKETDIYVFNICGKCVASIKTKGEQKVSCNLSGLPSGVYFVKVSHGGPSIVKFIKN
jgi:hypothetical protein